MFENLASWLFEVVENVFFSTFSYLAFRSSRECGRPRERLRVVGADRSPWDSAYHPAKTLNEKLDKVIEAQDLHGTALTTQLKHTM